MKLTRLEVLIVVSILALAGCATGEKSETAKKAEAVLSSDGKVEGTLTINRTAFPLKYVYVGREPRPPEGEPPGIEVLVTNEAISYETLSRIFLELEVDSFRRKEAGVLKGTSVKALYFRVPGVELKALGKPSYSSPTNEPERTMRVYGTLMTSDTFFAYSGYSPTFTEFEEASLKDGTLTAVAKYKWEQTKYEDFKNVKIEADYSFSFEAKVSNDSLLARSLTNQNPAWQEALARVPEEGKAQGELTVSDRVVNLSYAYALREKGSDKSRELITVLLTNKPVPQELLLLSCERGLSGAGYGLRLSIDESGNVLESLITHPNGQSGMFDATTANGFKVENGQVAGRVENKSTSSKQNDSDRDSYSVSFDAPLKN